MTTLILGGGVTGLLAGWHLHRRGEAVEVWEAAAVPGGGVQTLPWPAADGRPGRYERGPQGILVSPGSAAARSAARRRRACFAKEGRAGGVTARQIR